MNTSQTIVASSNQRQCGKKLESPLSAFNNLIMQISEKLSIIYTKEKQNLCFINQLLFERKSITILGRIKLQLIDDKISLKFIGDFEDLSEIKITIKYEKELFQLFQNYIFIISSISNNLDHNISQKYIDSIFDQISNNTINKNQMFLIPHKSKIKHLYDNNDKTLDKLYNKFSYIIKFNSDIKGFFKYKILRVLSSDLDESKSLDNIRFEDIEVLKENTVNISYLRQFLIDIFYYGEIKY